MRIRSIVLLLALATVACKKSEPAAKGTTTVADAAAKEEVKPADAAAATASADAAAAASTGELQRPFLYKIEKDGKTSHLMGTMHMGVDPARLPAVVWQTLEGSKSFAMEADLSKLGLADVLRDAKSGTLDQELGPEYWKKLVDAVGTQSAEMMKMLKPSGAAAMLEIQGLPLTTAMDLALLKRAQDKKLELAYLEEAALQAKLIDRWLDLKALKQMLDELAKGEKPTVELLDAYVAGDEKKILELTNDKSSWEEAGRAADFEKFNKEMLVDRNTAWIKPIETLHAKDRAFIAVGVAHLLGPSSVIDLLEKNGFTVTRVTP